MVVSAQKTLRSSGLHAHAPLHGHLRLWDHLQETPQRAIE